MAFQRGDLVSRWQSSEALLPDGILSKPPLPEWSISKKLNTVRGLLR
jgi:hypothetical protein